MTRLLIIPLGLFLVYAPGSYSQTYSQRAPVAQFPQCGYDFNCFYQQLDQQKQQEKLQEKEEAQIIQQNTFVLEEARLGEMQMQTDLMAQENERANYQDDKIEAQEEEIQSQKMEIENLHQTIDKLNSQIKNQRADAPL